MQSQDYKIVNVQPTTFEPDSYGNKFWQINVDGHDGDLLWKTKAQPERGQVVFGHTELSKSGKSMLFKKDRKEEGMTYGNTQSRPVTHISESMPSVQAPANNAKKDDDITWAVCMKMAGEYISETKPELGPEMWAATVVDYAANLYRNYNNRTGSAVTNSSDAPDLSEIPF